MITQWEEFQSGPTKPLDKRKHVTLNKKNTILLCGNIYEDLGSPKAVALYFDKMNNLIGLCPTSPDRKNAFPVIAQGHGRHRLIRATPFCKHHKIRVERTVVFPDAQIDDEGLLRLDLQTSYEVVRRTNTRR